MVAARLALVMVSLHTASWGLTSLSQLPQRGKCGPMVEFGISMGARQRSVKLIGMGPAKDTGVIWRKYLTQIVLG